MYLTFTDQDTMEEEFVEQTVGQGREIDLVVCTDAEAILGIGDQGVGVSVFLLMLFPSCLLVFLD